ncbi:MAG TPA: acyl-CoA desaturase [Flavobacteriales bacterium]|nr:acyl-CoA desaturase [Flavobacteriales bacterium]HMR27423.1 acyl-CoA desaturase [Flavobacteriales bacterium]
MPASPPRYIGPQHERAFGSTVRARVQAYFKETGTGTKANARLVPKVVVLMTLFLAPLVVMLLVPMPAWVALMLVLVMGVGMAGVGMSVMHDGLHGASSTRPWVNELLGGTMYVLGSDAFTWKVQHNGAHHTHTNVDGVDQDIDPPELLRFSEHAPLRRVHRFQHIYAFLFYGLLTLVKLGNDFVSLRRVARSGDARYQGRSYAVDLVVMVLVKGVHAGVFFGLPLWLTDFTWWQVLTGFVLMHATCSVILGTVFQLAHVVEGAEQPKPGTDGVIPTDWAVHELLTTANFAPSCRWLTWYTGGLNHQVEHHLFPSVSHLHYPAIAPIVQRTAAEFGVPYNVKPDLRAALGSHVRRLKQLGGAA